ncbi:MAG: DUF1778 domain-containing protein [Deltaproteobacteria bacterium]|nr:DUF1778 domain-containing protein [Deltaproteobacteria bacterium]
MSTGRATPRKAERLEARIPREQKAVLVRAAALHGQSLSHFVLASATEAAHRIIREREVLELSERDQVAFAHALLNPPVPSAALKKAVRRYASRAR